MELDINNTIINLRIISKIQIEDKIAFQNNHFIIEKPNLYQGIFRWKNGDNRNISLHCIEVLISNVFTILEQLQDIKTTECQELLAKYYIKTNFKDKERIDIINLLLTELKNALVGIENLKETYIGDDLTKSKIELLIEKINYKINNT
jgi:hypothetical protein